jgi:DNA-directed RNA polymerase specialized sigma24 family protein
LILREPPVSDEEVEAAKDESEITWSAKADNPEIAAIRSNQLSGFLSSLETKDRELVELLLRGSTTPEIAKRLGLTYTNAAVRIHRIRQLARNSMKT